ncbi:hypothetical protein [Streptomyces sp. NPDC059134]
MLKRSTGGKTAPKFTNHNFHFGGGRGGDGGATSTGPRTRL